MCEQLAQGRYVKRSGRDSKLRPLGCKSKALTTEHILYKCHNCISGAASQGQNGQPTALNFETDWGKNNF